MYDATTCCVYALGIAFEAIAVAFSVLGNTIQALETMSPSQRHRGVPMSVGWHVFEVIWWTQSTSAKYHWNTSEFGYTLHTRQTSADGGTGGRPQDFQSGPGAFLLNMFAPS